MRHFEGFLPTCKKAPSRGSCTGSCAGAPQQLSLQLPCAPRKPAHDMREMYDDLSMAKTQLAWLCYLHALCQSDGVMLPYQGVRHLDINLTSGRGESGRFVEADLVLQIVPLNTFAATRAHFAPVSVEYGWCWSGQIVHSTSFLVPRRGRTALA